MTNHPLSSEKQTNKKKMMVTNIFEMCTLFVVVGLIASRCARSMVTGKSDDTKTHKTQVSDDE